MNHENHAEGISVPTLITFYGLKIVITYQPTVCTMERFVAELQKYNVCLLVRVSEGGYRIQRLQNVGISLRDLVYTDGAFPPPDIVEPWLQLLVEENERNNRCCVAVHCYHGLGRAPTLVAVALMELGLTSDEAIEVIRRGRRGALSTKQVSGLKSYRANNRLRQMKRLHNR